MRPTLFFLLCAAPAYAQEILITQATDDDVMLLSGVDGSLINATFIDLNASTGAAPATPVEAIVAPNGEVWISDQIADRIFRFSGDGTTYLGESSVPLDNIRGFEIAYGSVWVSNSGTNGGAPGDALVQLDLSLNFVAAHATVGDPFDAITYRFNGVDGLLVPDIIGDDILFFDPANPAGTVIFHASDGITGIDFPEYLATRANGNVLAGGFTDPDGIYEYDSTGAQVQFIDTGALFGLGGVRGVYALGNGNILFTSGSGVHIYDPVAGTASSVVTGKSCYAVNERSGSSVIGTRYCAVVPNSSGGPGTLTAQGSAVASNNDVQLIASGMPDNQFGFFLASQTQFFLMNPGGSNGNLCLGGTIGRYVGAGQIQNSGAAGEFDLTLDLNQTPAGGVFVAIQAGETWNFQAWFRDTGPMGQAESNFTNGVEIPFQ